MKATDLRVGNLVLHNKQIFEIYDIISTQDSVIIGQGDDTGGLQEVFISEIEPIQLTEDILLKCGFKARTIYDDFEFEGIKISSCIMRCDTKERSSFFLNLGEENESLNIRLDYIHQLQNLYFSLTGQELNVTNLIN